MTGRPESCFLGAIGCPVLVVGLGLLANLFGGYLQLNLGGLVFLVVIGGVFGLALSSAHESGRCAAIEELAAAAGAGDQNPTDAPKEPRARRRVWTLNVPWADDASLTVAEAIAKITEAYWSKDEPEMKYHEAGVTVTFASRGVEKLRILELSASEATDSVTIRLRDDLGVIFAESGPWRSPSDPNADQQQTFHFVESIFMEDQVHAVTSSGESLALPATEVQARAAEDPGLQVRSWNGTFDRTAD